MKRFCTFLICLFTTGISFGQSITEVYIPKYIQAGSTSEKVPYVCRLTINGLLANTTYRYYNRLVTSADTAITSTSNTGNGTYTIVNSTVPFRRVTGTPNLTTNCGKFTTDNNGSYTGWFIHESSSAGAFAPGNTVYVRIYINDGSADNSPTVSTIAKRISASNSPITCINFGDASTTSNTGTGIRSTAVTNATAGNFVMLYDNTAGTGRPVSGAVIESDGATNTSGFAAFYATYVDGQNKTWGTIIPNTPNLPTGIRRIVQYSLADGSRVGNNSSSNGEWAKEGGGVVSTFNPSGTEVLVLDGATVSLPPPTPQSITFNALVDRTYGENPFLAGAIATSGLPVIYASNNTAVADTVRINGTLHLAIKGVGTAEITATQPGDETYGAAPAQKATLTVLPAELTIKADDKSWLKGTAFPELTVTYTGFKYDDDSNDLNPKPTITTDASDTSSLPSYVITASGAASPNYIIKYEPGKFTVVASKQSQTINFSPLPIKTYGNPDFSPGATATSTLTVTYTSSDTNVAKIINKTTVHIVGVGTTTITASQDGNGTYDPAPDSSLTLTVNKAMLTIKAEDKTRLFRQPNPAFTVTYSGFVNGENNTNLLAQPVAITSATIDSAAGTYLIKVNGAASNNYDFRYLDGILTIEPLPAQTITFAAFTTKKYGDAEFWPGAKASSGLSVTYKSSNTNVAIIVKDSIVQIVGAGTTIITASQAGNTTTGPAADVPQTLTVQKASLIIRADDQTKNQGATNPALTITYTGFVNGDDSSRLTTLPTANTIASTASVAGTYRIYVQGATTPNYIINHQPGVLTVLPAQGEGQDNINAYISGPGQLQVNVYAVNVVKVSVQLFDLNGSRVANSTVTLNKGFNTYRLPTGNLSPGIYNLRVAGGDVMLKTKIVIQ